MANNFCRYLSNGFTFTTKGDSLKVQPCCFFLGPVVDIDGDVLHYRQTLNQITSWVPGCAHCQNMESIGQQSLRQASFDWIGEENYQEPVSIDIHLDSACNAACVMCVENLSSLWKKENLKYSNKKIDIKLHDVNEIDGWIYKITNGFNLSKLRYIKFYGGEPMLTDTHIKFLEKIPCPQNVTLHYTTNGSIFPNDRTIKIWDKFKCVIFAASIDGVDQQFDYLRWPLTWDKVSKNLLRIKQHKIHNVLFRLEFTVNFLNAWYYDQVENWMHNYFSHNEFGDVTEINLHLCGGGIFDTDFMPIALRNIVLEKYSADHKIHRLIKNLPVEKSITNFFKFTDTWDPRRSNNWREAFAEIQHFIP